MGIEKLLKKQDVADIFKFSVSTLERHLRKGIFPRGIRLQNGHLRWPESVIVNHIKSRSDEVSSN